MKGLQNRNYIVTGGASGIGRGTAIRLIEEGARVALLDLDPRVPDIAAELGDPSVALPLHCDVADAEAVERAVHAAQNHFGALHGVVTSAGVFDERDLVPIGSIDLAAFDRVIGINLRGTVLVVNAAMPLLASGASIVLVASTAGLRGHGFGVAYTASKGGVIALTRLIALQQGPNGVRVNCVCPGATAGEGMGLTFNEPGFAAAMTADVPLRRVGTAAELGTTIVTLLSDDTSYMTGQVIAVDGGATIR